MPTHDVTRFIDYRRGMEAVVTNMLNDTTSNGRLVRCMHNTKYGAAEFKCIA